MTDTLSSRLQENDVKPTPLTPGTHLLGTLMPHEMEALDMELRSFHQWSKQRLRSRIERSLNLALVPSDPSCYERLIEASAAATLPVYLQKRGPPVLLGRYRSRLRQGRLRRGYKLALTIDRRLRARIGRTSANLKLVFSYDRSSFPH